MYAWPRSCAAVRRLSRAEGAGEGRSNGAAWAGTANLRPISLEAGHDLLARLVLVVSALAVPIIGSGPIA